MVRIRLRRRSPRPVPRGRWVLIAGSLLGRPSLNAQGDPFLEGLHTSGGGEDEGPKPSWGQPRRSPQIDAIVEHEVIALVLFRLSFGLQQLSHQVAMHGSGRIQPRSTGPSSAMGVVGHIW
jgi:hypothetical protein